VKNYKNTTDKAQSFDTIMKINYAGGQITDTKETDNAVNNFLYKQLKI
jgi:hypothetical protein